MMPADTPRQKVRTALLLLSGVLICALLWRSFNNAAPTPETSPAPVIIEIRGQVPNPGIYLLKPGLSTLSNALASADCRGATPEGDREMQSGEALEVHHCGPDPRFEIVRMEAAALIAAGLKLDINSASEADLMLVPRMQPEVAEAIVKRRGQKPWENMQALEEINGVGPGTIQRLDTYLRVLRPDRDGGGTR